MTWEPSTETHVCRGENGSDSFRPIRTETETDSPGSDFSRIVLGSETNTDFFVGNEYEYSSPVIRRIRIIRIIRRPDIRISAQKRKGDFN